MIRGESWMTGMGMATVLSRAQHGMEAIAVRVEVDTAGGLPAFTLVGLPETVVKESRDRVRAAIANSGYEVPRGRITVNLSPADLPKEGGRFDLPIALGILVASQQLPDRHLPGLEFYGELSLDGELRPVRGALPAALAAASAGRTLVVPEPNGDEARLVSTCEVATAAHLLSVCAHLEGTRALMPSRGSPRPCSSSNGLDLADVRGQAHAKRALEVAAAGQHNLLLIGPPGTGKTMLAQRLPGLLPPMSEAEALELATIQSAAGIPVDLAKWRVRPFRSPHHTASAVALVGGGARPRPGEISLAHHGVLFLDELPEFQRRVLEALREPLESRRVSIARAAHQVDFPAGFQLIGAMNACPCGHLGDGRSASCRCTIEQIQRYRARISGPLLDRIDLHIEVPRLEAVLLTDPGDAAEPSEHVAARVAAARRRQLERQGHSNSRLCPGDVLRFCTPAAGGGRALQVALTRFGLSARACERILKVARTLADLAAEERIQASHVAEALAMRRLDRGRLATGADALH